MGLKLIGEVALDGSGFERGLSQMANSVKGFIAGSFGLYAVEGMMRKTIDSMKELANASALLGLSSDAVQVLKQAAKDGGKDLEAMAKAFLKINEAREKALSGSPEGLKLLARFGQLGISQEDLQTKSAGSMFWNQMHNKALTMSPEDLGPILKALGKGLPELIPVLQADFGALEDKIRKLGGFIESETIAKLKTFGDTLDLLASVIAVHFAPTILHIIEKLMDGVSGFLGWMDKRSRPQNPDEQPPEGKKGFGSGLWSMSGKVGSGMMGALTGLLGLGDEAFGVLGSDSSKALAEDRLIQSMQWFKLAGISGGWMEDAADQVVKDINQGKLSLKQSWDQVVEQWKKEAAELAARLKDPIEGKHDVPDLGGKAPHEKAARRFHESGDALIRVGNFLGSSRSVLEDIAQKQVQLLQRLVTLAEARRIQTPGPFDMSDDNFPV